MDYAQASKMTIEDLIKLVESHQPQSNRHYFIEFSKFGVTLTTGEVERNSWGTTKRDIVARGLESCIRYILHD